ncbi:MAG: large conductance mechanosensitive channel protein MscL [Coriobacteriales bacterium]|jgi:large conductance mechanosensitive channel
MSFMSEFRDFINRGNVMDMAVGVIIGGAFTAIVTSLTDDIINPLITFITGGNGTEVGGLVVPGTSIDFGAFISAIINFLIIALIVFLIVKAFNKARTLAERNKTAEEESAPTCPYCLEEIKEGATRCPHCAGDLTVVVAKK